MQANNRVPYVLIVIAVLLIVIFISLLVLTIQLARSEGVVHSNSTVNTGYDNLDRPDSISIYR